MDRLTVAAKLSPGAADQLTLGRELAFDDDTQRLNLNPDRAFRRKRGGVHEERSYCAPAKRLDAPGGLGATRAYLKFELNRLLPPVLNAAAPDPLQRLGWRAASQH